MHPNKAIFRGLVSVPPEDGAFDDVNVAGEPADEEYNPVPPPPEVGMLVV